MNKKLNFILLSFLLVSCTYQEQIEEASKEEPIFMLQDLEGESFRGDIWENSPDNKVTFSGAKNSLVAANESGSSLAIDYNFSRGNDLVGGMWLDVAQYDLSNYKYFGFWIKGEESLGYSSIVGVTFEDNKAKAATKMIANVSTEWQKIEIPIEQLEGIDLSKVVEVNITIDKRFATKKAGRIYIDSIFLR